MHCNNLNSCDRHTLRYAVMLHVYTPSLWLVGADVEQGAVVVLYDNNAETIESISSRGLISFMGDCLQPYDPSIVLIVVHT